MPLFSRSPYKTARDVSNQSFDYIVVGGGTAGCVLAARLSENPRNTVLLIERGPAITSWASRTPLISSNFSDQKAPVYKWASAPLDALGGKTLTLVTGKALGGSTKINGLIYSRSLPAEYNAWERAGRKNWGWKHVEPFFKKSETSLSHPNSPSRGRQGPWKNQSVKKEHFETVRRNIAVSVNTGIPLVEANSPSAPPAACTTLDATIDEDSHRCSTDVAFLPNSIVAGRKNLTVCTETIVLSLDIISADDSSLSAIGAHLESDRGGPRFHVSCDKEIVLCAGAIATPQLLLLSGIGPEDHLRAVGVKVLKHLPGVGAHLQDHISVPLVYKVPLTDSIEVLMGKPLVAAGQFLEYIFHGKGIFGQQVQQANLAVDSTLLDSNSEIGQFPSDGQDPDAAFQLPDTEVMFLPVNTTERKFDGLAKTYGAFSYLCSVLRPESAGSVRLASLDPRQQPLCDLGTLSSPQDRIPLRKILRFALFIAEKVRMEGYPLQDLLIPEGTSDSQLDAFVADNIMTTYHYSSSCRMNLEDRLGVVDDQLRVYGVKGLRIADASIFPQIPACHLQAPVVMVAERCADFVLSE